MENQNRSEQFHIKDTIPGSLDARKRRVYEISLKSALKEYAANPAFRSVLCTGRFVYVESCFCINDTKYVRPQTDGTQRLTAYARRHPQGCCLAFAPRSPTHPAVNVDPSGSRILFRTSTDAQIGKLGYAQDFNTLTVQSAQALGKRADEIAGIKRMLPSDFGETLIAHMKRLGVKEEQLANSLLVAPKTVQRALNNDRYQMRLSTVVGMTVALHLDPILGFDLVGKAGLCFRSSKEQMLLELLLSSCYNASIYECNDIMRANGFRPLTNET